MVEKEKLEEIKAILDKGSYTLRIAEELLKLGAWDDASSRAYYGAFHSVQAALLYKNLTFSRHRGVISAFNKEFVHKSVFEKKLGQWLENLFKNRLTADYDYKNTITSKQAFEDFKRASTIHVSIKKWLEKEFEANK